MSRWSEAAEHYLGQALDELRSDNDPIPDVTAALACLRIDCGEQEPDEDLLLRDVDGPACICRPELIRRGGFSSGCPAEHG